MSDLAIGVRFSADSSGLVGQLRLTEAEARKLGIGLEETGTAARKASVGADALAASSAKATGGLGSMAAEAAALRGAIDPMYAAQQRFDQQLTVADQLLGKAAISEREYAAAIALAREQLQTHARTVAGSGAALKGHASALGENTLNVGRQRAGYQQLGAQVQDTFVQISGGTSVIRTLSLQLPQAASAVALLGSASEGSQSKFVKFAGFLSGPWGAALFGAVSVGALLIESLIQQGRESAKSEDKALSLTEALSKEKFGTKEALDALKDFNKEKRRGQETDSLAIDNSIRLARARLQEALATRKALQAELERQQALFVDLSRSASNDVVVEGARRRSVAIRQQLADQGPRVAEAEQALNNLEIDRAGQAAKDAVDPLAAINRQYDRQADAAKRAARGNRELTASLEGRLIAIERTRKAELKAEGDRQAAERKAARPSAGTRGELSSFDRPVSGGSVSGRFSEQRSTHRHQGVDYAVPVGTPIRAPQSGVVDFQGTAGDYGNLLRLSHGAGTQTRYGHLSRFAVQQGQAVERGDVIGYTGGARGAAGAGNSQGPHLHYEVRVNGKAVDPSKGQFPIDPVDVANAGDRAREVAERKADALQQFGDKARESIASVLAGFDKAPSAVDNTFAALRKLDALIEDTGKKKPVGFEGIVADAASAQKAVAETLGGTIDALLKPFEPAAEDLIRAKEAGEAFDEVLKKLAENRPALVALLGEGVVAAFEARAQKAGQIIQTSLGKPFRDAILEGRRSLDLQRLQGEGKTVEAGQQAVINDLMREYNAKSEEELALALQARGVTADELKLKLDQVAQEEALGIAIAKRQEVERTHLGELDRVRSNIERTIEDLPQRGIKVLGDFGRELQGQFQSYLSRYITETLFGGAFKQLERSLTGQDQVATANKAYVGQIGRVVTSLEALETAVQDAADRQTVADGGVVITAQRPDGTKAEDPFDFKLKSPRELFGDITKGLLENVLGDKLAGKIGDKVGAALQGAATGRTAAGLLFGSKANGTGSAIGGGIGQLAGESLAGSLGALGKFAGPFGAIAGGILGSVLGNLFSKPKFGSAVVTSATGDVSSSGRGDAEIQAAKGLGGSVQEGLKKIAAALDAELGAFAVTIGSNDGNFRVNTSGASGLAGKKGQDVTYFDKDEAGAVAFAITDAIGDGAVKGVSAAVQKALSSSKDLETSLAEALKVKGLEELLSGTTGQIERQFKTFERAATDRLRIAKEYGFDLLEVEKRNAEDRVKLVDEVLGSRVGALKDLLTDLSSGNLSEGSAAEKRRALLTEISAEEAKATAGEEGAAKRLADLNRRLVETSREAFGTAGAEYGSDRATATSSAERIIALENDRVKAAQDATAQTNDALKAGNKLADEGNDLAAQQLAELRRIGAVASFSGAVGGGGTGGGRFSTSRSVVV